MSYGKAVEEVWEWRKALGKEIEGMEPAQQLKYLNTKADEAIRKYGIKVRLPSVEAATHGTLKIAEKRAKYGEKQKKQ